MAPITDSASSVQISLSAADDSSPPDARFAERRITLDRKTTSVGIGRASKVEAKGFVADKDNGWFDSPVMSRQHAEIVANLDEKKLEIRDLGSLHGTFINDELQRLNKNESRELNDGDRLVFGVGIQRGDDSFAPTTLRVGILYSQEAHQETHQDEGTTSTFQVPDESDDDSEGDGYSSDDSRSVKENAEPTSTMPGRFLESTQSDVIDLTEPGYHYPMADLPTTQPVVIDLEPRSMGSTASHEIIDLSSPPHSPYSVDDKEDEDEDMVHEVEDDEDDIPADVTNDLTISVPGNPATLPATAKTFVNMDYDSDSDGYSDRMNDYSDPAELDTDEDTPMDSDEDSVERFNVSDSERDDAEDDESIESGSSESEETDQEEIDWDDTGDADFVEDDEDMNDMAQDQVPMNMFWDLADQGLPFASDSTGQSYDGFANAPLAFVSDPSIDWETAPRSGSLLDKSKQPSTEVKVPSGEPVANASKSTVPVRIEGLLNPPTAVFQPAAEITRQASPSDAAMPKRHTEDATGPKTTAEVLGAKTGKSEFFAAREENKKLQSLERNVQEDGIKSSSPQEMVPTRLSSSVHALCNEEGPFRVPAKSAEVPEVVKTLVTEKTVPAPISALPSPPMVEPWTESPFDAWPEPVSMSPSLKKPLDSHAPPVQQTPALLSPPVAAATPLITRGLDLTSRHTHAGTRGLDLTSRRTHVGIPDIVDGCQLSETKGKRKAHDISELSGEDEKWFSNENLQVPAAKTSVPGPLTSVPPQVVDFAPKCTTPIRWPTAAVASVLPTSETAPITATTGGRPAKRTRLRSIAERATYAALGGVAATAMVFGTLIYTAPTFV
ncbi:hypothetical protein B0H63DRAFT_227939 [Podospora didyma]|uniref:FHA domain-containing protein n=1 Tax=Podospora didyma TaxID=330526 RepID=A0AAE0NCQ8_9PEZI|nr:hypothetical protein B0H63DRAFT_227939 [Podospora didyma]